MICQKQQENTTNPIHIIDNLYSINKQVFVRLENVDYENMKMIYKNTILQNQMAKKYEGFILQIDKLLYDYQDEKMYIRYKDDIHLQKIQNQQFLNEEIKCQLFNQACVLLKILSLELDEQKQILSQKLDLIQLNNQNFFLYGESKTFAITFISENLWSNSQDTQTYRKEIAKLIEYIIQHPLRSLDNEIIIFFQEQINQLKQDDFKIQEFLTNYQQKYNQLQQEFCEIMPKLPNELLQEEWLIKDCAINSEDPIKSILENKMINLKKYKEHALLCQKQQNFDSNYYYYFKYETLLEEQKRIKKNIDMQQKLEKVINLFQCYKKLIDDFQFKNIPILDTQDPTEQYFILSHIENELKQKNNEVLLSVFRIYFSQIIDKLNEIDEKEFEFNQIKNEIDPNFFNKERNKMLLWHHLDNNQILNRFITYTNLKNNDWKPEVIGFNKKQQQHGFKITYFIYEKDFNDEKQIQIGYAVDEQGNYYKGSFENGELIFGDILQVFENSKIIRYDNVSTQNKIICGDDCIKILYDQQRQNYQELENFKGNFMNGLYYGEGILTKYHQNETYKGVWINGQLEGGGTLKVLDLDNNIYDYVMYQGNFHEGKFHDEKGKFYLNSQKTQYEIRKFQNGKQIGKRIRYIKRGASFQKQNQ